MPADQAGDGSQGLPACFRYDLKPLASKKANVFKPNVLAPTSDPVKHQSLGALLLGNMNRLIDNKRASVVWEAPLLGVNKGVIRECLQCFFGF